MYYIWKYNPNHKMKKIIIISFIALAIAISFQCTKSKPNTKAEAIKLELPETPYAYNVSQSPTGNSINLYEDGSVIDNKKATVGRVLFYDKALSLHNNIACASCHLQKAGFADVSAFSNGFNGETTTRNSMAISNLFEERSIGYFWDLREKKIESMVLKPIENHIEMGFDRVDLIAEKISNLTYYKELFKKYYGDEDINTKRIQESLGTFLFSIVSTNSKFDEGLKNNFANYTTQEKNGKALFLANNCNSCHLISKTPLFPSSYGGGNGGSNTVGNIGLEATNSDNGIGGSYKIPRLKNIALTAPYMHDGRFKTLEEVLEHYSHNIKPNPNLSSNLKVTNGTPKQFNFSPQNKLDLIAFLNTLTDQNLLIDPKFSNPFR